MKKRRRTRALADPWSDSERRVLDVLENGPPHAKKMREEKQKEKVPPAAFNPDITDTKPDLNPRNQRTETAFSELAKERGSCAVDVVLCRPAFPRHVQYYGPMHPLGPVQYSCPTYSICYIPRPCPVPSSCAFPWSRPELTWACCY